MMGKIERYIREEISKDGTVSFALIDSEDISYEKISEIALNAERCGVKSILVGGSTAIDPFELDSVVKVIKRKVRVPVILFPGNVTGISPNADAILFSSLLNSDNPYFITEAQALGAFSIKKYGLEAIPMGYIVIGEGGTIGFIGRARGIPPEKPSLVAMYTLAAKYMGMRFVYLEAGSGVTSHISSSIITKVRDIFDGILIVGGGIRRLEDAKKLAKAGADILVIGTLLETEEFVPKLKEIVEGIKNLR
ncbi:MAG: geranylgeranylglyceryl/heptaprenylglyceryl phosphate synthase [Candidatus Methylarchaceae archaeon HK01B]|nr:geranylgeranylglyceryl/heptaprenylglyceryl phosphate synthase [Candidatus Methylarchaceae archaeon HK01M]MCP8312256.1 geranylgeranylglyceryl/heptaprenylglyceryl phosphate synthase [Candidatus Methylarchaceae archaeon HK02M1]MCP8318552.1 geranylgeranylglyceryl/heptaprenylglyceryl phosphate synthase [Candidatus Methylarchaceae archaeon HK01B]